MNDPDPQLRVGIIQLVLTDYRCPFFERFAANTRFVVSLFAGQPIADEGVKTARQLSGINLCTTVNHYWQANIRRWLQDFDPDVLVVGGNPRIWSHWSAIMWMHGRRRPVLGWGLGELERTGPVWLQKVRRRAAQTLVRALDGMIAYSSKAKADYVAAGVAADQVVIAHNSVDDSAAKQYLAQLGADRGWMAAWRQRLGLASQLPIVLFVGRLIPQKRLDLLVEACIPLLDRCQLLIVGDGPSKPALEYLAQPCKERIRFAGYQVGMPLAKCFIAADLFVLPGAGGLAVHQAMGYGKAILVSFGDGTEADLVREGQNGSFFKLGDVADLRAKITRCLDDPTMTQRMGEVSLAIIRSEINLDAMVASFTRAVNGAVPCTLKRKSPA